MKKKTLRPIKSKLTGQEIPIGTEFEITFVKTPSGIDAMKLQNAEHNLLTSKFNLFFKEPSLKKLEKWSLDGICESVTGKRVETDGYGPDGSPSWFLVMGMI